MSQIHAAPIRLMMVAPGHFHAALLQKHRHERVDPHAHIFAPLDDDLLRHLKHIHGFNHRTDQPTDWRLSIHTSNDSLNDMLQDRPGNTVVIAGRNRPKISMIQTSVEHGLHVLADKPWIIDSRDLPRLERVLSVAKTRNVVAWDMMTERHDLANRIVGELIQQPKLFGTWKHEGTASKPASALSLESVHFLKKTVAGETLQRPVWWFDESIAGDSLADVGTHLVDLALAWIAPQQTIDASRSVSIRTARRWTLDVHREDFTVMTGRPQFPETLRTQCRGQVLSYWGNGTVELVIGSVPVRITALWELEAPPGDGDRHTFIAHGSVSTITSINNRLISLTPVDPEQAQSLLSELQQWCECRWGDYPKLKPRLSGTTIEFQIPDANRLDHELLFARVFEEFVKYYLDPRSVPDWVSSHLLTKYRITTQASELARIEAGNQ